MTNLFAIPDILKDKGWEGAKLVESPSRAMGNPRSINTRSVFQESARVSIRFDIKEPVSLFTGRKQELSDLHSKIQRGSEKVTVISQMTSISGLGGVGKTELAREYINEHSQDYDNNVIWIDAESEVTLKESFRRLAEDKLRISTKNVDGKEKDIKSIVEEVYKFFSKRKSLFVFDNAEKGEDFNKFLPLRVLKSEDKKPYIVITSRNKEWERGIEVIELKELKLEDAIEFVKKGLSISEEDKSQDKKIESLVKELQLFPLAVQQAIAYIEDQRVTGEFEINDYLTEYKKKTKELLSSKVFRGIDNDYTKTTFTTWQITIDKIRSDEQNGQLALKILDVIAYLAPEKINRGMLLDLADSNEEQLKTAVRLLVKYSMVNGEQKQSVLSIHRLVQQVTRLELKNQNQEEETLRKAFELLKEKFPYGSDKLEDYAKKRQLLPHLEAYLSHIDDWVAKKPEDKQKIEKDYLTSLLIWMNDGYGDLGDPQKQKELLERALAIQEKHYGPDHFEVAITLVNLGNAYGDLGDPQKQKELLERALPIFERQNHPIVTQLRRMLDELDSLDFACRNGNLDMVKALMEEGADVLARNNHDTVLHQAVSSNNEEIIRLILDKIKEKDPQNFSEHINAKDTEGDTPLMWAAQEGKVNAAKILLEYDADIDIDKDGKTPLHNAIQQGEEEIVKFLAEEPDEKAINIPDNDKKTPLHQAVENGNFAIAEILVKNNANVNAKDKNGKTPLHLAAFAGNYDIADLLVKNNANYNIRDKSQRTPSQIANDNGKLSIVTYLKKSPTPEEGVWFDVDPPVETFAGRKKELRDLHKKTQRNTEEGNTSITVISQIISVSGLGGIGKSSIARKYAQRYSKYYGGNVIWINAETYDSLKDSFYRLAKKLKVDVEEEKNGQKQEREIKSIAEDVYKYFANKKSLFIFDNAEKYKTQTEKDEGIDKFLPLQSAPNVNKPNIIITSRKQNWDKKIKVIELKIFSEEEAKEFIKKALEIRDESKDKEVKELAKELEYFPLALKQAVSYINDQKIEISEYIKEYKEEAKEMLDFGPPEGGTDSYTKTVYTTWKVTFGKIEQKDNGQQAIDILNMMAYFVPDSIAKSMFSKSGEVDRKLRSAIQLLTSYSMVREEGEKQDILDIHRLVQQVIRLELKTSGQEEETLRKALELLKDKVKTRNLDKAILQHAISVWNYATEHEELIQQFIEFPEGIIKNSWHLSGFTVLHYAAQQGHIKVVKYLVEKGADFKSPDKDGKTPLHWAAKW